MQLIYTLADLQIIFAIPEDDAMRKALRNLVNTHDFPKPLPGMQCRWPRAAVDEWLVTHGLMPKPKPAMADFTANDNATSQALTIITSTLEHAYASQ